MTERELRLKLEDNLYLICKLLLENKDLEMRLNTDGVKVFSLDKKLVIK